MLAIVFGRPTAVLCGVVWLVHGISYFASRSRLLSVQAPQRGGVMESLGHTDCLVETPAACFGYGCHRDPRSLGCDYCITIGLRGSYSVAIIAPNGC
jgi:hypothetical protein